jgi:FdhD protein
MPRPQSPPVAIRRWDGESLRTVDDRVAAEEPLQIYLDGKPLSIVMRTPGNDIELTLGLLWAERVITSRDQVVKVRVSAESGEAEPGVNVDTAVIESNHVDVHLREGGRRPERSFMSSSACGVCGATTMADLALDFPVLQAGLRVRASALPPLADRLREGQAVFDATGGLHAAGLFSPEGEMIVLREDIGRHNAVDKVVGRALLDGGLPAAERLLAVSGRAGYEVVQKAVAAGIGVLVAVGAPSSLAVATALRFNLTLVGFLKRDRFNVYSAAERIF